MKKSNLPPILMKYDFKHTSKYLIEKLEPKRSYDDGSNVFELSVATVPFTLHVPKRIVVYGSVNLPKSEPQRILFAHKEEENDFTPVYASLISLSAGGFNHASNLFDFCFYNPKNSLRIYDAIRKDQIDFKKLENELSAPSVKLWGHYHPLRCF